MQCNQGGFKRSCKSQFCEGEKMMTSMEQTIKVPSKKLAALMKCPICDKLFRNPMTIPECLHTFCRKCISKKITDEKTNNCPVCSIDLGCDPFSKLRLDHNWRNLKVQTFSYVRNESKDDEAARREVKEIKVINYPQITNRNEMSLSSLVNTNNVSKQKFWYERRNISSSVGLASRDSPLQIDETIKKNENYLVSPSSPLNLSKTIQNKNQKLSSIEPSTQQINDKDTEIINEPLEEMADLWEPLKFLVDVATKSSPHKSISKGILLKRTTSGFNKSEGKLSKAKIREAENNPKADEYVDIDESQEKPGRMGRGRPRKQVTPEVSSIELQTMVNTTSINSRKRVAPIWLSLIASKEKEGDAPLPQLPSRYLMIKDANLPVSFIKKYIVHKLNLEKDDEVEISLWGKPLFPTLEMHSLMDVWLQTNRRSRIMATAGSSAGDVVMVLSYGRRGQPS